jgi:hypothetical protein
MDSTTFCSCESCMLRRARESQPAKKSDIVEPQEILQMSNDMFDEKKMCYLLLTEDAETDGFEVLVGPFVDEYQAKIWFSGFSFGTQNNYRRLIGIVRPPLQNFIIDTIVEIDNTHGLPFPELEDEE